VGSFFDPRTKVSVLYSDQEQSVIDDCWKIFATRFLDASRTPKNLVVTAEKKQNELFRKILNTPAPEKEETKGEFDRYIDHTGMSVSEDPTNWFKINNFPAMLRLFREYCSAPAAATAIEHAWSDAGNLITRK